MHVDTIGCGGADHAIGASAREILAVVLHDIFGAGGGLWDRMVGHRRNVAELVVVCQRRGHASKFDAELVGHTVPDRLAVNTLNLALNLHHHAIPRLGAACLAAWSHAFDWQITWQQHPMRLEQININAR